MNFARSRVDGVYYMDSCVLLATCCLPLALVDESNSSDKLRVGNKLFDLHLQLCCATQRNGFLDKLELIMMNMAAQVNELARFAWAMNCISRL